MISVELIVGILFSVLSVVSVAVQFMLPPVDETLQMRAWSVAIRVIAGCLTCVLILAALAMFGIVQ